MPNELVNMETFWSHSLCTALAARALATHRHEAQIERFFVGGLLHDLGSLLIYRKLPELAREALLRSRFNGTPLHQAEREIIGFDHATVSLQILRVWRLPEHLQEIIEFHHTPMNATLYPRDAALIHLADALAGAMNKGSPGDCGLQTPDKTIWELAGLNEELIDPVIKDVEKKFEDTFNFIYRQTTQRSALIH